MITLIHGDNEAEIARKTAEMVAKAKERNIEIIRLDGKRIEIADLERAIGTDTSFASEKLVCINGFLSRRISKDNKALQEWVVSNTKDPTDLLLVEYRKLTATQLKPFSSAKLITCLFPKTIFLFLEELGVAPLGKQLERLRLILENEDAEVVFSLLVRQLRLLLQFKSDGRIDAPPFVQSKVASQAGNFTMEKLLALHSQLMDLDEKQKTSSGAMPLAHELDLFLALV